MAALSPPAATEELPTPLAELLERLRGAGQQLDAAEVDLATLTLTSTLTLALTPNPNPNPNPNPDPDPDPNPNPNPNQVDLATFVRIMITKAVADYTAPDAELLPAFEALDRNGDGTNPNPNQMVARNRTLYESWEVVEG